MRLSIFGRMFKDASCAALKRMAFRDASHHQAHAQHDMQSIVHLSAAQLAGSPMSSGELPMRLCVPLIDAVSDHTSLVYMGEQPV